MITYRFSTKEDMGLLMKSRIEMLRVVNGLSDEHIFLEDFTQQCRDYFANGLYQEVLAFDDTELVGCATMCDIFVMPTYSHPTGKRAHLMNVYTRASHRRKGIGRQMLKMLVLDAKKRGVTEITLDATELGRPLYEACGFVAMEEGMGMDFSKVDWEAAIWK